jgi:hypothetical protein
LHDITPFIQPDKHKEAALYPLVLQLLDEGRNLYLCALWQFKVEVLDQCAENSLKLQMAIKSSPWYAREKK